jgi:hypothetical protein
MMHDGIVQQLKFLEKFRYAHIQPSVWASSLREHAQSDTRFHLSLLLFIGDFTGE